MQAQFLCLAGRAGTRQNEAAHAAPRSAKLAFFFFLTAPTSVEGTTPGPRAAASDDEAGEVEAGEGEAEVEGQGQGRGAPRGLGTAAAEADAKGMDVAEAPEASADSAAGANLRPRPEDWETWSTSKRAHWRRKRGRKQQQDKGPE